MKNAILFLHPDQQKLKELQWSLREARQDWDMLFVCTGDDALKMLEQWQLHAIVLDVGLSDMTGLQFLNAVRKRYPDVLRIILSDGSGSVAERVCALVAHQVVSRDISPGELKDAVAATFAKQKVLTGDDLKKRVLSMNSLPSLPWLYQDLEELLGSSNASLTRAGDIICRDVGMAAKVLQLVNSASIGLRRRVYDLREGVVYIGLEKLRQLMWSGHVFSEVRGKSSFQGFLQNLWLHSYMTGIYARQIACSLGKDKKFCNIAFTAGLLHDVGKIIFAEMCLDRYTRVIDKVRETHMFFGRVEEDEFGFSHSEIGYLLL